MTVIIEEAFDGDKPLSCAQGRYGELIIAQGNGVRPKRWTGSDTATATDAGIDAPAAAATCTLITPKRYYVARCDVTKPGACYNNPPAVTFSTFDTQPEANVVAKASAYLSQSSVGELIVTNGGKHYSEPPTVLLSATHGTGAVLTAVLDGDVPSPSSITQAEMTKGPPFDDEVESPPDHKAQYATFGPITLDVSGTGGSINTSFWIYSEECDTPEELPMEGWLYVTQTFTYTISGAGAGAGCKIRIGFYGQGFRTLTTDPCFVWYTTPWGVSGITVLEPGTGYAPESVATITIPTGSNKVGKEIVIECRTPGNSRNTATPRFAVKQINITNGGSGYTVAPELKITSNSGFGAYATCGVTKGVITSVNLESGGGGYKTVPTVQVMSGAAEAFAVARPHLRGTYQCYYRYVDDTPEGSGGPIPSSLSPVQEVNAVDGAQGITWAVTPPSNTDGRSLTIELWRTTGNQALALYRVVAVASSTFEESGTYTDDLTDEELRSPERAGYAAMPIVMPNGDLNANRFTPPPSDKAVVVRYQDRFWYGVDTSGSAPNSILFSEVDEPESVPDINEFVLQQNSRDSDTISALIPFGSSMLVMQTRHSYSVSFAKKPLLDADVTPIAYRGCLGQRCWDIHDGICYVMDQYGIYSITPQGEISDLSAPIADAYLNRLAFDDTTLNFLLVDARTSTVRAFVSFKGDNSQGKPTRVLCYSIDTKSWWIERYPHAVSAGLTASMPNGDYRCMYAGDGGVMLLDEGAADIARGAIAKVVLTEKGSGYRTPPTVSFAEGTTGVGAELSACINAEGEVSGIWIISAGYGYEADDLVFSAPDDPDCLAPVQAEASFEATPVDDNTSFYTPYRFKTGNAEFPNDSNTRGAGSVTPRDISLTYKPQPTTCEVAVRLYYNNSSHPRFNVSSRNRGIGFTSSTVDSASRLDMGALTGRTGYDTGVAKGVFSGRSIDDIQSSDRHVAVELLGARRTESEIVFYELDVYGTAEQGA